MLSCHVWVWLFEFVSSLPLLSYYTLCTSVMTIMLSCHLCIYTHVYLFFRINSFSLFLSSFFQKLSQKFLRNSRHRNLEIPDFVRHNFSGQRSSFFFWCRIEWEFWGVGVSQMRAKHHKSCRLSLSRSQLKTLCYILLKRKFYIHNKQARIGNK